MSLFEKLKFFKIIPQQTAGIIERFGKFHKQILPGINFKLPLIDHVSYTHSLKEESVLVERQTVITKDNVSLIIDGMLFLKIEDPYKASYSIEDPNEAVSLLTLTLMRNEIGKIELDRLFQERDNLNQAILTDLEESTNTWGIKCLRYEILNIDPPETIKKSMQQEAEAERNKRRDILISEGKRQSEINYAEGKKSAIIQKAEGEALSVQIRAEMESKSIQMISEAIKENILASNYILSQNYLDQLEQNLQNSNVIVYPEGPQGQGQDLMGFAAMIMLQNQKQQPTVIQGKKTIQNTTVSDQTQKQPQKSNDKKYDDPILYSDEDKF